MKTLLLLCFILLVKSISAQNFDSSLAIIKAKYAETKKIDYTLVDDLEKQYLTAITKSLDGNDYKKLRSVLSKLVQPWNNGSSLYAGKRNIIDLFYYDEIVFIKNVPLDASTSTIIRIPINVLVFDNEIIYSQLDAGEAKYVNQDLIDTLIKKYKTVYGKVFNVQLFFHELFNQKIESEF